MERIFATNNSWIGLILRLGLGLVMFSHGAQHLLGWFGGPGFDAAMTAFTVQLQLPKIVAVMVVVVEFFGGVGLILGAYARIAAFGVICLMAGAIALVHWSNGFFISWTDGKGGQGFEFHLLAITIGIIIMIWGAGRWSVDRALEHPRSRMMRERAAEECAAQPPSHL